MIAIVDYGMGNVGSVANTLGLLGVEARITLQPEELHTAERLILPGVGAFGEGMKHLRERNLIGVLRGEVMERKKPFLGICLGMQLLADVGFEFGEHEGLGWIPGRVKKIQANGLPLPHVGWNNLEEIRPCPILQGLYGKPDFYFVHSFHFDAANSEQVHAQCEYGSRFPAVVVRENVFGVQFHPEKSQKAGRKLLENFLAL